uniref:protein-tyrosine-phosphatase n=1 Tax=Panagrolaimus superbus TaxID=310955 RepID=A0A914Z6P7_9BILA
MIYRIHHHSKSSQSSLPAESPVSRKCSRNEEKKCSRKRRLRSSLTQEMLENPTKRLRPQFQRAFSTGSSPDATTTKYSLKVVNRIRSTDIAFGRIDSKYLADLINKMGDEFYEQYILIDCRYPFEYNGGHIKGAINLYDPELLRSTFYPKNESTFQNIHAKKPIFYCEFSSVRGPNMANALRELDRELNHDNYPHIDYTEIYVLSEGYRHFYENSNVQTFCEPASYIPMSCEKYLKELRKYPFHKKNECFRFSIRFRSTQAFVRAHSTNF